MPNIVVPTWNAAPYWTRFSSALLACVKPEQVLIIDSSSTDGTAELARSARFQVVTILQSTFNHGATRQMAAEMLPEADILVYLTQDAVLAGPDAIATLIKAFDDSSIGVAYGRQLPKPGAGPIEAHARLFNYPAESEVRDLSAREQKGFKAVFISNSFSAYRRSALMAVGGFHSGVILSEDTIVAANMLLAGWQIAYVAEAKVYHSHSYTWKQEFQRYFDIGVLHSREQWLLTRFGRTDGEGRRYVVSEMNYLLARAPWQVPSALIRTGLKLMAYRLGLMESKLGAKLKQRLSMHHAYWSSRV
jgi:rhamnosyltransferase